MFGEKLRVKIDTIIQSGEHASYSDSGSYLDALKLRNLELQERVAQNIGAAQERMKASYDKKAKVSSNIYPGDWVLVKDEARTNTLAPLFMGPWLVVERLGVNVHLIELKSKRKQTVHLNRCKLSPNRNLSVEYDELALYTDSPCFPESEVRDIEEVGGQVSEEDTINTELESISPVPRRSTRMRREPDRYGDMEVYWQNKGNQETEGAKGGTSEGEGEL